MYEVNGEIGNRVFLRIYFLKGNLYFLLNLILLNNYSIINFVNNIDFLILSLFKKLRLNDYYKIKIIRISILKRRKKIFKKVL